MNVFTNKIADDYEFNDELELLGPLIYVYCIFLQFNFVSFYHSILFLPQIHLILYGPTFFADEGMFPLFTHLSADHLVNNVAIHIYTHDKLNLPPSNLQLMP